VARRMVTKMASAINEEGSVEQTKSNCGTSIEDKSSLDKKTFKSQSQLTIVANSYKDKVDQNSGSVENTASISKKDSSEGGRRLMKKV